ncbi:abc transporter c family member 10 [Quercus suber]|uniref:Abc transporter c family member 10 n=1 Tax=Quercus suber TaxID=58331 RepID=A0AAW0K0A6_QUESU
MHTGAAMRRHVHKVDVRRKNPATRSIILLLASNKEFQDLVNAHKETAGSERLTAVSSTHRRGTSSREIRNIYIEKELQANEVDGLIKQEERETGDMGFKPYKQYLNQNKGFFYFFTGCLSILLFVVSQILQNSWMAANIDNPVSAHCD